MNAQLPHFSTWCSNCSPIVGGAALSEDELRLVTAIQAAPKAELHFHVEGAVLPIPESAAASDSKSPQQFEADFFRTWRRVINGLSSYDQFREAAAKVVAGFHASRVVWAEVFVSPPDCDQRDVSPLPFRKVLSWWAEAFAEMASSDCEVRLIVDLVRLYPPNLAEKWLDDILDLKDSEIGRSIIGIGFGGPQDSTRLTEYQKVISRARRYGLLVVAHAGEMGCIQDIDDAVLSVQASRIGHAYGLTRGTAAYDYVQRNLIPIESCPTASVKMGACPDFRSHPVKDWVEDNAPVIISSDDPALFGTELAVEFLNLHRAFGWGPNVIARLIANGFQHSTMLPKRAQEMCSKVYRALGVEQPQNSVHMQ